METFRSGPVQTNYLLSDKALWQYFLGNISLCLAARFAVSLLQRRIKNWKKHFDRQWHKLRGRRRAQQYYYNHPARPSLEALDSRQRTAELDVLPVYTRHRPVDAPAYDAIGNHVNRAVAATGTGVPSNCVSRVDVRSGRWIDAFFMLTILTARRCARVVLAVALCLSVCPSQVRFLSKRLNKWIELVLA